MALNCLANKPWSFDDHLLLEPAVSAFSTQVAGGG